MNKASLLQNCIVLSAHQNCIVLSAHQNCIVLSAHQNCIVLSAHQNCIVLSAHQNCIVLSAHQNCIVLSAHQNCIVLSAHQNCIVLSAHLCLLSNTVLNFQVAAFNRCKIGFIISLGPFCIPSTLSRISIGQEFSLLRVLQSKIKNKNFRRSQVER